MQAGLYKNQWQMLADCHDKRRTNLEHGLNYIFVMLLAENK